MSNTLLIQLLQDALLIFLILGSSFTLCIGIMFTFAPRQVEKLSSRYNKWVSLRRPSRAFEIPRNIDHHLYRFHALIGIFILLSAVYILYQLGFNYRHEKTVSILSSLINSPLIADWLLSSLILAFSISAILLVVLGAVLVIRPSALKSSESHANRWISTRKCLQPIEKKRLFLDSWFNKHPRKFGVIIFIASLYNLVILLMIPTKN